ncbi:hypothetical protein ACG74X_10310 [Marivita sp. S0852]|uniref:hypothetical protein n=1 Tax=Marivita sp. S0852 TaxID=3373893 RepID=UPI0039821E1A
MSVSDPNLREHRRPFYSAALTALKEGQPAAIFVLLGLFLTVVAAAVMTWGIVALSMVALALVPIVMITLVLITVGK